MVDTTEQEVSLPRALFTQSDWSGPVVIGSWYGRYGPWRRIFAFVVLSSWSWTLVTLYHLYVFQQSSDDDDNQLGRIPIIQARTREEIETIKLSHQDCFNSLCEEVGRSTAIHCVVNDDGVTSRVEYGIGEEEPEEEVTNDEDVIYFPEACHHATEVTFGDRYLDGFPNEDVPPIAFIALSRDDNKSSNNSTSAAGTTRASLLTLLPDCSLMISDPDVTPAEMQALKEKLNINVGGDWNDLYQEFQQQQGGHQDQPGDLTFSFDLMQLVHNNRQFTPGYRENNILKNVFCMDEMPPDIQQKAIPQLATIYNFLMDYRQEILTVILYASNLCFSCMTVTWLMFRLIIPAMVMKRVLAWPRGIGLVDIWRTLLLLTLMTSFRLTSPVLASLLALGAMWFGNFTAAMEWSFLGMLAWGAPDTIYPFLDDLLGNQLSKLDGLNILYWTIHLFIIGEGWWKLVTIYVVYRAYEALFNSMQQLAPPIRQTQLHLNPQQQRQPPPPQQQQQQQQQQQRPQPNTNRQPPPQRQPEQEHVKLE